MCKSDANFVLTNAIRKAADPLFQKEFINERYVSSKLGSARNGRRARHIFFKCRDKENNRKIILIWCLQESSINYSAGRVKRLLSITKAKIVKSQDKSYKIILENVV